MKKLWSFLVVVVIFASTVKSQQNENIDDKYDEGWWSEEASLETQELKEKDVDPSADDDYTSLQYFSSEQVDVYSNENINDDKISTEIENDNNIFRIGDVVDLDDLDKLIDEANAELTAKSEEKNEKQTIDKDISEKLVQEEIKKLTEEINGFDDYQVEDNRSETKDEDDISISSSENDKILNGDDQIRTNLEKQVVADAKKILEEANEQYEEDMELYSENNMKINNKDKRQKKDEDNKNDDINDYFEDIIANNQNREIQEFLNELKSNRNKGKKKGSESVIDKYEQEDVDTDYDKEDDISISKKLYHKYENDMIDPEENEENTVNQAYRDLKKDLNKLFETMKNLGEESKKVDDVKQYEEKYDKPFREDVVLSQRENFYDSYKENDDNQTLDTASKKNEEEDIQDFMQNIAFNILPDDDFKVTQLVYKTTEPVDQTVSSTVKTIKVDDLTREQYADLMSQFASVNAEKLNTTSKDFGKSISAIHISLSADDLTEITSPNYPNTYPTNNVIDWILEGEGMGIEINITDLDLRGLQADFLLIKPGGLDDQDYEGLIFSYHLNKPRMYRFTDVNRIFVRFQSGTGFGWLRGFNMTVKMIWPPEIPSAEDQTMPEPLLPTPKATLTVNLGGVSYPVFQNLKEDFRRLVADMATMYINANGIEAGLNTTSETTQITNVAACNINWPNFESCVQVTFGVPIVYENEDLTRLSEGDLRAMWTTYVNRDPFAARLRSMGISEFEVPNESGVMLAWVILAAGVVISVSMLSFALWRYSCSESYTRMNTYVDGDSHQDKKRDLDLYPTPHQTLPPLYTDNDMKWADAKYDDSTRVDLGGFANLGYARDELTNIDSDEDIISPRVQTYTTDV